MALTNEKKGEIALAILRLKFKEDRRLPLASELRRNMGNASKITGFSKEELMEFTLGMIDEIVGELVSEAKKVDKTGETK